MNKYFTIILIILMIAGIAFAGNLLTNGDFEQELDVGWQQSTLDIPFTIERETYFDQDPNYEVLVLKTSSNGFVSLYQVVDIPNTDIDFSGTAKMFAFANLPGDWAGAAVIISYIDESDAVLGETRICTYTTDSPWVDSPTLHLIVASDANWHDYSFNIDDELTNLSGVNPLDIKKLQIAVFDTSTICDS